MLRLRVLVPLLVLIVSVPGTASCDESAEEQASPGVHVVPTPALPPLLPTTVPGPAPAHIDVLTGTLPTLKLRDGSSIPEIAGPTFLDYQSVPDDVYDWVYSGDRKYYVYILSIRQGGKTVREGEPGFDDRVFDLSQRVPGWESWFVEYALVGSAEAASRKLAVTDILRARVHGVTVAPAGQYDRWWLRRSVDNIYRETLIASGLGDGPSSSPDVLAMCAAAAEMAQVGRTGKEKRAGWHRACALLELALTKADDADARSLRPDVLRQLAIALIAVRDEPRLLMVLGELARLSPGSAQAWRDLARFHLHVLGLPEDALRYAEAAHRHDNEVAAEVRGDTLSQLGRHAEAIRAYASVRRSLDGSTRLGEAYLRAGAIELAERQAMTSLDMDPVDVRATLLLGCVRYAQGRCEAAREAFLQACVTSAPRSFQQRAMACYDLGLTCLRLGQADAAAAAFDACESALRHGASPGPSAAEQVSPALGRVLLARGLGRDPTRCRAWHAVIDDGPRAPALRLTRALLLDERGALDKCLHEARACIVLAPDCEYAYALCSEILAARALVAHVSGGIEGDAEELAHEALDMSGLAVANASRRSTFGDLLRQRDRSLRTGLGDRAPAGYAGNSLDRSPELMAQLHEAAAMRLLRLAEHAGDRLLAAVYARSLVNRYADRGQEDSAVGRCVREARRLLAVYGRSLDLDRDLPPLPPT